MNVGSKSCSQSVQDHLATALGVEAVKAGRSVYFSTLADIIASLAKAEREGCLRERCQATDSFTR
jgi:DNA replication protein DnaC